MATIKTKRLNQIILKDISDIVQYEVKDPDVGFVTITGVEVSNDHSYATVYCTFLGKKERNDAGLRALNRARGFVRSQLAQRLDIRRVPEINFVIDDVIENGKHIDEIIQEIHKTDSQK